MTVPCRVSIWLRPFRRRDVRRLLEILGDSFELVYRPALVMRQSSDDIFQAMIEMILYERFLSLHDCLFDCRKLLGDVDAFPSIVDHLDDRMEVPFGAPQPFGNCFMMMMNAVAIISLVGTCR
jgi:hypothetical protein